MSSKFWSAGTACLLFLFGIADYAHASTSSSQYGDNAQAATTYKVNGISLYVESYGQGSPLLLIHGNDQSISYLTNQITYFSDRYQVFVVDSRGHGNSEVGDAPLTYKKMAADYSQLLEILDLGPVDILGWSDGGNIGLLLAIEHPEQVNKLAITGANLNPRGAHDWVWPLLGSMRKKVESMIESGDRTQDWARELQLLNLLETQPDIAIESLRKITAPTLVMAGDKDVIRNSHTLEIFENISNTHLCIFPGSTHWVPEVQPDLFNTTVGDFLAAPFSRPTTREIFEQATGANQ